MEKLAIFKEFFEFMIERKKFWLIPIIFILFLLGALIVAAEGTALSPFIYALF